MSLMVILCNIYELQHFELKWLFDPSDPTWLRIDIWPITYVEGLKLMNMYESYDHAV